MITESLPQENQQNGTNGEMRSYLPFWRSTAGSEVITNWERYAMVFSFSSGVWLSRNQLTRMPTKASV